MRENLFYKQFIIIIFPDTFSSDKIITLRFLTQYLQFNKYIFCDTNLVRDKMQQTITIRYVYEYK